MATLHDFSATSIDGKKRSLAEFSGKVCLVVNVASRCGLTPQYAQLQQLYETYRDRGLEVLGFPCNQFGGQEPGSEAQIQEFCTTKYHVTFPMFSKIDVNGEARDPLYTYLTSQPTSPDGPGNVLWNFAKFLVAKDGAVLARFNPRVTPTDPALVAALEKAL
jgi:glutathione peroxidase